MGAGRTEVVETLFGVRKKSAGKIYVDGKEARIKSPSDAIRYGFCLLTEDRKQSGCFLSLSVRLNTVAASLSKHAKGPFIMRKMTVHSAEEMKKLLSIKTPGINTPISNLSGGNQQKVLVGRWLLTSPDILIFDAVSYTHLDVYKRQTMQFRYSKIAAIGRFAFLASPLDG